MKRLGCKIVSQSAIEEIRKETELFISKGNKAPSLAVILVGNNPASETYVRNKTLQAEAVGFVHFQYTLDGDCEEQELLSLIDELNERDDIDGILVQLPLPKHLSEKKVIERISPDKDVDGFSAISVGKLCHGQRGQGHSGRLFRGGQRGRCTCLRKPDELTHDFCHSRRFYGSAGFSF